MRQFFQLFLVIVLGISGGGLLAWQSIQSTNGFGALNVGAWSSWPSSGDANSDPYTRAKVASYGEVPLGAAEGIAFTAPTDDAGELLLRECSYELAGKTPPARMWTLAAHDLSGLTLDAGGDRARFLVSTQIARRADGSLVLHVGPQHAPLNWLATKGRGRYQLVLRLYDTPITSTSGILDTNMPAIRKTGCQS